MSKVNKYKTEGVNTSGEPGERKQRDHTKTGKLARRKENRRLGAIARQVRRIQLVEAGIKGEKVPETITKYISTFKAPAEALVHANRTLVQVRGGSPSTVIMATPTATSPPAAQVEGRVKASKYKKRKAAAAEKTAEGGTTPTPAPTVDKRNEV